MLSALAGLVCIATLLTAPESAIVRPADLADALTRRQAALLQAMERERVPLWQINFEDATPGRLGAGKHGESVLNDRLILGYVGSDARRGNTFDIAIVQDKENRSLRLVDHQPNAALYVRAPLEESAATIRFSLTFERLGPMTITCENQQVVIAVPSQSDWGNWFPGRAYRPRFVYLQGSSAGEGRSGANKHPFKPVAIGASAIEEGQTYRLAIRWDNATHRADVWLDDRQVIRNAPTLSNEPPVTSFIAWRTGSFTNGGLNSDAVEVQIDQLEAVGERWRLPPIETRP